MKFTTSIVTLASFAYGVSAQGAPNGLAPSGAAPAGCLSSAPGRYGVQNVRTTGSSKRSVLEPRLIDCSQSGALVVTIQNGVMLDSAGRIAEIVANRQFQFDGPPAQVGTIYDAGWSLCPNGSLAIGPTTVFYQCLSGSFYNVYDQPVGAGCIEINQQLMQCADNTGAPTGSAVASGGGATTTPATTVSSAAAATSTGFTNSTVSVTTAVANSTSAVASASGIVSQTSDGQPQATTPATTSKAPIPTGAATQYVASGALVAAGAFAAYFL